MKRIEEIAKEIDRQIIVSAGIPVYLSWGVSKKRAIMFEGKPTFSMRVNGLLHKGWVYVIYNEVADDYSVALMTSSNKEKKKVSGVYCDCLADVIDRLIEKAPGMTTEEYEKEIKRQRKLN